MESYELDFDCVGIEDGGKIPISHTGRGQDISPEFIIWNLSPRAKYLAVTVEDLSHPIRDFTHWVI
ncbi:MAG: YbhB/YbcL family Raf kinase inhibitor-like protein, partial [Oscillospiraceae bacterium]|nr:YbhB/YbcL family Raf kinase inhibitor-like protein [Oscillospiraceae bacterium]